MIPQQENEFHSSGLLIIDALTQARRKIELLFSEDFMVPGRIINLLNEQINRVRFEQCGMDPLPFGNIFDSARPDDPNIAKPFAIGGPLTKLFGKEINQHLVDAGPAIEMTDELRKQVNDLEKTFLDLSDDDVLAMDGMLIRALAKHLKVIVPETVNLKLIADIRLALSKRLINTMSQ